MKITDIKPYPVWVGGRNQLIVKVETDEGLYGWGESGLAGREMAVVGAIRHYREWLIGRDPLRMGALWQEMYRSQYFEGGRVLAAAISAMDIALYDIAGKALGVPVYQLLGGKQRAWIPCFASTKAPMGPALVEHAQLLVERGWPAIRTFFHGAPGYDEAGVFEPWESIGKTAHWLAKVREAIGPGPVLGVDYHHRLSVAEAAAFCQRMPPGTLDFIEEPIRDETPEAYAALRRLTAIPFATGEEFASSWQFAPYLERGITQYARIDVCNVGGLTEARKVAALAESHYIDVMPHNPLGAICTAATVHLAAAIPNFAWLEMRRSPTEQGGYYDPDWFPVQPELDEYRLRVPDMPGLGVEFNEERAKRTEFRYWEAPHLRRADGSVTNW
ncbi:MAG: mandelate racemase/muconate lactonizing enzyme family protein [Caldilineaceae bacterium]|nr:mandelate racemase/muconate lactonizing enzyme family protein [Caldilineaceae bacterium]